MNRFYIQDCEIVSVYLLPPLHTEDQRSLLLKLRCTVYRFHRVCQTHKWRCAGQKHAPSLFDRCQRGVSDSDVIIGIVHVLYKTGQCTD